jgi:hypothetical protein
MLTGSLGRSADTDNQTLIERENDANVFLFVFVVAGFVAIGFSGEISRLAGVLSQTEREE